VVDPAPDPVEVRRARIATGVRLAKRLGYGLLAVAMIAFLVAVATDFPAGLLTVTVVALVAACLVLPVPIVLGYGLRAAEREEREERARRASEGPPST
jgi:hypothetical protein